MSNRFSESQSTQAITLGDSSKNTHLILQDIMRLGQFACQAAERVGIDIVFSFVDQVGAERYFFVMDDALLVSHELATQKAWTAVALKTPTSDLAVKILPGQSLYGLQNSPKVCCIGGGVPIWKDTQLLGAIGISGGTVEQDCAIAQAAISLFTR
ncbi:heme-binding protein [Vibrio sp. EA2]|uniref:GlcG/HbpS family heme-binding protein n=1 Tax=Vibrio sp. EA2 TaxID=3079860 RepID=UPI00294A8B77|nr:heme-binding protein [Vibrio sp. EA2]MDV6251240.1 heme-binding protein [Vibrio sp. EA2]